MSRAKADEVAEMGRATARARNGNARYQVDDEDGGGDGEHRSLFERAGNRLCRLRPIGALRTRFELWHNAGKPGRMLEIGPGRKRNPGFETLNIIGGYHVNYVLDARSKLPFKDETFELLYASHILEHIPWYQTDATLKEWTRVLRPGGKLQIWVPDGLKVAKALIDFELHGDNYIHEDGWYRFNPEKDPCKWAAGRIFTYGDGSGDPSHPNWHRALFTPRYLQHVLHKAGLTRVRLMDRSEVRGADHGWVNLGAEGTRS